MRQRLGERRALGEALGVERDAQSVTLSSRPNARSNRSPWRSAAQRATVTSSSACRRSSTVPSSTLDVACAGRPGRAGARAARRARSSGGAAVEQRRRRRRAPSGANSPSVGRALAVVAGDLADQRGLARREAGQAGVEDQVARVLVVVVVVDGRADVVQHRRRPQQLALLGSPGCSPAAASASHISSASRATCSVCAKSAWYWAARLRTDARRTSSNSGGSRREQRLEEDALAQAGLGGLERRRSRRPPSPCRSTSAPARIRSPRSGLMPGTVAALGRRSARRARSISSSSASRVIAEALDAVGRAARRRAAPRRRGCARCRRCRRAAPPARRATARRASSSRDVRRAAP